MPDIVFSFGPEETGIVQTLVDEFNQQNPAINVIYRDMPADTGRYHQSGAPCSGAEALA